MGVQKPAPPSRATRAPRAAALLALPLLAGGCVDTRPSSGACRGTFAGAAVEWALAPERSDFHRDDDIFGDEDAPFRMSFGDGALEIDGELADMPSAAHLGAHPLPTAPILHFFFVRTPGSSATFEGDTMTLTTASRERMGGELELRWSDASALRCTFDLRRNYALDTDD